MRFLVPVPPPPHHPVLWLFPFPYSRWLLLFPFHERTASCPIYFVPCFIFLPVYSAPSPLFHVLGSLSHALAKYLTYPGLPEYPEPSRVFLPHFLRCGGTVLSATYSADVLRLGIQGIYDLGRPLIPPLLTLELPLPTRSADECFFLIIYVHLILR
jgi:hypothetical protein